MPRNRPDLVRLSPIASAIKESDVFRINTPVLVIPIGAKDPDVIIWQEDGFFTPLRFIQNDRPVSRSSATYYR
jgi:hypothetical protein